MSNLTNQLISNILFWLSRKKWLVIAFFISVYLFYVETPEGLTSDAHRTLIIVVTALILIVSESIPLPAIAMCAFTQTSAGERNSLRTSKQM